MKNLLPLVGLILLSACFPSIAQVVINEYSYSNFKHTRDNFGKFEDWFELYNTSSTPADISGFMVSDKVTKPSKWIFPAGTIIPGNGILLVWASDRDTVVDNLHYHTNFKLTQTGIPDKIIFRNSAGIVQDSLTPKTTQKNHSYGRAGNGGATWGVFTSPTPGVNNSATVTQYTAKPTFSKAPGFYSGSQSVSITTTEPGATIRYTLNGLDPSASSNLYSGPLTISNTKLLKARVFAPGKTPGFIEFGTYFINENHTLPVLSIGGDSLIKMLNDVFANGIQYSETKPEGSCEYYDASKVLKSKSWGEYNRHGQDSWSCDQRSLDYIARDEMGYGKAINEKLYSTSTRTEFQTVIIRASGDDNYPCGHNTPNEGSAHMRDGYIQNLADRGKMHLDVRRSERLVLYVDGQYWGVYEIRERPDDHDYTEYYYNQAKEDLQYVLTWGSTWAEYGGQKAIDDFQAIKDFIMNNDMANAANYKYADSLFNFKSLVDYIIVNNMTVCTDWLNYNTGSWRGLNRKGDHKKWGYILWDNDATFDFYINYTGVPSTSADAAPCNTETQQSSYSDPESHLEVLNKLMVNPEFKKYYRNRQADLLNTVFSCSNMLGYLDEYTAKIDPEMARHATRWSGTYSEWKQNVAKLRTFISNRCYFIEAGMRDCYNLTGPYTLTIDATPGGTVKMNSLTISTFPWTGKYYGGIETDLIAKPFAGYAFDNWSSTLAPSPNTSEDSVHVNVTSTATITANFSNTTSLPPGFNQDQFYMSVYPSVFSATTNIEFNLPKAETATIEILSTNGAKVLQLENPEGFVSQGGTTVTLDLSKSNLAPGVYIVKVHSDNYSGEKRIVYAP